VFVHNETKLRASLKKGAIERPERPLGEDPFNDPGTPTLERVFATVAVHERFRWERGRLIPEAGPLPKELDAAFEAPLTNGTSVTVAGVVDGSTRGMLARRVRLGVGEESLDLVCRGPRQWMRSGQRLVPSEPAPFEPFALDWKHAYGGVLSLPPGRDPRSGLPHPAGELPHPMNPAGVGYAPYGSIREGVPLPRVELLHDQMVSPEDSPIPGGVTPCSDLPNMRWRIPYDPRTQLSRSCHRSPFFIHHPAPFYLVFDALRLDAVVTLTGLRGGDVSFTVPPSRSRVRWDGLSGGSAVGTRIRALHVDVDQSAAHVVVQHTVATRNRLPRQAIVQEEAS
jgi:hypothetical protein